MSEEQVAKVVAAVEDLLPAFRERAQETEDRRALLPESVQELEEAGVFRLLQPQRWGGYEAHPVEFFRVIRSSSSACGSTGWVSSVVSVHNWQLGLFPDQAQQDIWGEDSTTRASSSYAPTGTARKVDGGDRLDGRWSFSSGCDHATWVLLGGIVTDADDKPVDFCTFLLPRADYAIEDVWHTVGLRGTGSNDIVVSDAFVPAHRALSFNDTAKCYGPGHEQNTGPLYRIPYGSIFPYAISTPILGMATGAYDAHISYMQSRVRASFKGVKAAQDPHSQVRVGNAAADIDSAWLALENNFRELMEHASGAEKIPMRLRARVRRDQVRATAASIEAVDRLFENSGGRALAVGTPIQRFWRDAHSGRVHAINDVERALSWYGMFEFGMPIADAML